MPFGTKSRDDPNEQRTKASGVKNAEYGMPVNGVRFRTHQSAWDQRHGNHGTGDDAGQTYPADTDPRIGGRSDAYGAFVPQRDGYDPSRRSYERKYSNAAAQDSGSYQYYGKYSDEYRNYGIPPRKNPQKKKDPLPTGSRLRASDMSGFPWQLFWRKTIRFTAPAAHRPRWT